MDRQRILTLAGGLATFAGFVALGAYAIVSLVPPEQPIAAAKGALLMENTPSPRAFDEPTRPASPSPRADLREPPPLAVLKEATPSLEAVPPAGMRGPGDVVPDGVSRSSGLPLRPIVPTPAKPPRPVVAALPSGAVLPGASPPGADPRPSLAARPQRRDDGTLTPAEIRRFRLSLRLTREQEPYWLPVEQALTEIGTQQAALVRAGQNPKDAFGIGAAMRIYPAARPLLGVLREDQKARVRDQARAMGFGSYASSI